MFKRDIVLSEKMNIRVNLGSFITLLLILAGGIKGYYVIRADINTSIQELHDKDKSFSVKFTIIEDKFDSAIHELHLVDENLMQEQKENRESNTEVMTRLSAIDTDLKWIINNMK